jgi:hypothetical protein
LGIIWQRYFSPIHTLILSFPGIVLETEDTAAPTVDESLFLCVFLVIWGKDIKQEKE